MSDETLPSSWTNPPIGDCCDLNPRIDKSSFADGATVHFVPMPAVEALTNKVDVSATRPFGEVKKGYTPFTNGDVIFAKITPCMENGKIAVVPELPHQVAFGSTEFHVLRPRGGLDPLWFFYFLSSRSFRSIAEHNMTGAVGQRRVPIDFIARSTIPLPPLAEQKRIVAKIEELFSELEAGEESLRVARRQLGVYRQSLLKQAFEGKLTEKWRAQNPAKCESPTQLLASIQSARQSRYEQQLKEWELAIEGWKKDGKTRDRPSKPREPEEPDAPSTEHNLRVWGLPVEWAWTQLGAISFVTKLAGFEYTDYVRYDEDGDLKVIKAENAGPNGFKNTDYSRIKSETIACLTRSVLNGGELLVVFVGAGTGNVAIVPSNERFFLGPNIAMARADSPLTDTRFIELFLRSPMGRDLLLAASKAVAQPSLSMGTIRQVPVPLCSLREQQEIIRLLDAQFEVIEQNEREIDAALQRSEALRQAILKKAFTGRLVAQDPADEPASALLARLRAARDSSNTRPSRPALVSEPVTPAASADDLFPEVVSLKPLGKTDLQAGIVALAFNRFSQRGQFFGHTIAEKVVHLADHLADLQLDRHPVKDAAGPNDFRRAKEIEHRARMKGWFTVSHDGPVYHYHAGRNLPALLESTRRTLGSKLSVIETLLEELRGLDTREIEVRATVYAAWNNLLLANAPVSEEAIVTEAREKWHARKLKIPRDSFFRAIEWMKKNNLVPSGTGRPVTSSEQCS